MKPIPLRLLQQQRRGIGYPAEKMSSTHTRTENFILQWAPHAWLQGNSSYSEELIEAVSATRNPLVISVFYHCVLNAMQATLSNVLIDSPEERITGGFLTALQDRLLAAGSALREQGISDLPLSLIRHETCVNWGEKLSGADFGLIVHSRDAQGEFFKGVYIQAKRAHGNESANVSHASKDGTVQIETLNKYSEQLAHYLFYNLPKSDDSNGAVPPFTMASAREIFSAYEVAEHRTALRIAELTTETSAYLGIGLTNRRSPIGALFTEAEAAVAEMVKPFDDPEAAKERLLVINAGAELDDILTWRQYIAKYTSPGTPGVAGEIEPPGDDDDDDYAPSPFRLRG